MKLYVYIAAFVSILIALAQLGSAIMIVFLAVFSIAVMALLIASIMDINQPPNKRRN